MKFLVDNQPPAALARWFETKGADAIHVLELGMDTASDMEIWLQAAKEDRIVVSKDEDFFHLANRLAETGRLLWVRVGNCRREVLLSRFENAWTGVAQAFAAGHRIVTLL